MKFLTGFIKNEKKSNSPLKFSNMKKIFLIMYFFSKSVNIKEELKNPTIITIVFITKSIFVLSYKIIFLENLFSRLLFLGIIFLGKCLAKN